MPFLIRKDDLLRLAQIVREETGNKVDEKNHSMLESRMRTYVLKHGFQTMDVYWQHFSGHEDTERAVIQSLMTTHYTFFFREFVHFEAVGAWINSNLALLKQRQSEAGRPLRVWSAACSSGQEVYSLAMFLERNLLQKHRVEFEVMGTDIDPESVKAAVNGVYRISEVNTIPNQYLKGNWKRGTGVTREFAVVHPDLKKKTRFSVLNLLDIAGFAPGETFDVIFCRNVFIYFSEENVNAIAKALTSRLSAEGMLVSGLSEPLRLNGWNYQAVAPSCYQLPRKPAQSPTIDVAPVEAPPAATALDRRRPRLYKVLCVDDSATIQSIMKKIFESDELCAGMDFAANGREAREKLDKHKFDLITLDIHMPDVNGVEFLERFYDGTLHPPVVMISSVNRADAALATRSLELGAFDYVEKPAMNNLQKSAEEILTKARMAMRSKFDPRERTLVSDFDSAISHKIVVPDASRALRIVTAGSACLQALEQVVRGFDHEFRSPALLILWPDEATVSSLEAGLLKWSERPIVMVRAGGKLNMKPNCIYVASGPTVALALAGVQHDSVSIQLLDTTVAMTGLSALKRARTLQVLLDESLLEHKAAIEREHGILVSDITPATSFPSLSVEYFANMRKAAA